MSRHEIIANVIDLAAMHIQAYSRYTLATITSQPINRSPDIYYKMLFVRRAERMKIQSI